MDRIGLFAGCSSSDTSMGEVQRHLGSETNLIGGQPGLLCGISYRSARNKYEDAHRSESNTRHWRWRFAHLGKYLH